MLTEQQIIDLNPINQKAFTDEHIAILQNLTNDELKQLATAYPAAVGTVPFLILHDSGKKVQNGAKATYATLFNLRVKNGQGHFSISTVVSRYTKTTAAPVINKPGKASDLTAEQLDSAPGIKRGGVKEAVAVDPKAKKEDVNPLLKDDAEKTDLIDEKEHPDLTKEAEKLADEKEKVEEKIEEKQEEKLDEKKDEPAKVEFKPYTQRNKTELLAEIATRPHLTAADGAKNKDLVDLLLKDDAEKK